LIFITERFRSFSTQFLSSQLTVYNVWFYKRV